MNPHVPTAVDTPVVRVSVIPQHYPYDSQKKKIHVSVQCPKLTQSYSSICTATCDCQHLCPLEFYCQTPPSASRHKVVSGEEVGPFYTKNIACSPYRYFCTAHCRARQLCIKTTISKERDFLFKIQKIAGRPCVGL